MGLHDILLVDDDPDDRMIIEDALRKTIATGKIRYASDGEKALELLRRSATDGTLPRVVVMDLNMPKISGTQVLEVLKKDPLLQSITVIIYSTSVNLLEKEKCMAMGAHSYIIKPITYMDSLETARFFLTFCQ